MMLDPKGLEAAAKALMDNAVQNVPRGGSVAVLAAYRLDASIAVRAYLAVVQSSTENPEAMIEAVAKAMFDADSGYPAIAGIGSWGDCDGDARADYMQGARVAFYTLAPMLAAGRAAATPDPPRSGLITADPKGPCPTCGTADAVDMADGWTQRLDDLYAEWCRGHAAGLAEAVSPDERLREALRTMIDVYDRHDRWCGHYAQAPGDGIIHRIDGARNALAAADREVPDEEGRICCRGMGADGGCNICAAEATR